MTEESLTLVVGLHIPQLPGSVDAASLLQSARTDGYDYVTTSLPIPGSSSSSSTLPLESPPRSDVVALESRWWRTSVVGIISDALLSEPQHVPQQMEWAHHMNIPAVILPKIPNSTTHNSTTSTAGIDSDGTAAHGTSGAGPMTTSTTNKNDIHSAFAPMEYARLVSSIALTASTTNGQVWITTTLTNDSIAAFERLVRQCDGANNIGMMLQMDNSPVNAMNASAAVADMVALLHRAIGASLKCVSFPTHVFLTNKRGYPALSKTHQILFTELLRRVGRTVRVLVEGPTAHPLDGAAGGATHCLPYLQYIRHLRQRPEIRSVLDSSVAAMEEPYLDHLQRPLQPLGDHLEFSTYETFEKDPVKYTQYQAAIALALRDLLTHLGIHTIATGATPATTNAGNRIVCLVVAGAGRGPLVTCAIKAISALLHVPPTIQFRIFAIEKNPSAVVYLQSMAASEHSWKGIVTVVPCDMRKLKKAQLFHQQADIVISELLGSFGDNELSPECLDDLYATGICKESTVCIPTHYTSYIAPVSSHRLHSEARAQAYYPASSSDGLDSAPMGTLKVMETPYVVRTHAACQTHIERPCWEFSHFTKTTNNSSNNNNAFSTSPAVSPPPTSNHERTCHVTFKPDPTGGAGNGAGYGPVDPLIASLAQSTESTKSRSMWIHGFLGTFTAILYASPRDDASVLLSTRPSTFSSDMFSWFPLYFPLKDALYCPSESSIMVTMWRKVDDARVWYEWAAQVNHGDGTMDHDIGPDGTRSSSTTGIAVGNCTPIHNPNGRSYHVKL